VTFTIDEQLLAEDTEFPYTVKLDTGSYSLGSHTLSAVGYTKDGRELHANEIRIKFVSAGEGWKAALKIAGPILALVVLATVIGIAGPVVLGRGKNSQLPLGEPRNYGLRGGAICPRCGRPYVL
jgi:hypothetical protein